MKKSFLFLAISAVMIASYSCGNKKSNSETLDTELINNPKTASDVNSDEFPVIKFTETEHNFENIFEGEVVEHTFHFKNDGKTDLLISDAKASCGCTVPEWPKKPIAPGEEGDIKVKFDSKGKQGNQNKTITVLANTNPNTTVLKIRGVVVAGTREQE